MDYLGTDLFAPVDSYLEPAPLDGLCHLVFLDGQLVDLWTSPVEGTKYACLAHERRRRLAPPPPPSTPAWQVQLEWLDALVGGRRQLLDLTADRLVERELPEEVSEVGRLVDEVSGQWFADELRCACRNALVRLWELNPVLVHSLPPAELVAALVWTVGRANGATGHGGVTQKMIAGSAGLVQPPSSLLQRLRGEFRGIHGPLTRPFRSPDLLPLRHPDLLTSRIRDEIIRLRDEALDAQRDDGDQPRR